MWIKHTQKFATKQDLIIKKVTSNLTLQQTRDHLIMKDFFRHRVTKGDMKRVNRLQLFLHVTKVIDMSNGEGIHIVKDAWQGKKMCLEP